MTMVVGVFLIQVTDIHVVSYNPHQIIYWADRLPDKDCKALFYYLSFMRIFSYIWGELFEPVLRLPIEHKYYSK